MFRSCSSLTSLDLSSFDTSAVTSMNSMFRSCSSLTSLDLSGFNTSAVTDMSGMFYFCSSLTSAAGLHLWDVTACTNFTIFMQFTPGMTTPQYDATLIAWAAQNVSLGEAIHFGASKYTAGGAAEAARNTLILTHGWTITDGGPA